MGVLQQNIQIIRKLAKSRTRLAALLNKNFPTEFHYTDNQIEHYETDRTSPDEDFKKRLSQLIGVTVSELEKKRLTISDIKFISRGHC